MLRSAGVLARRGRHGRVSSRRWVSIQPARCLSVAQSATHGPWTEVDGEVASKFTVIRSEEVPDYHCHATLLRHNATGGQVLSVQSAESNKVFGVSFRTPVDNDKGIPHILEHSVLCGSEKYPLREPFVELLKSSVQTFLNAFTYPDRTCYPVSSQNTKDFYNLVDVYMDAVFKPRLTPMVLQQEGWHLELEDGAADAEAELSFKGVVFNEMKGVYSSSTSIHYQVAQQELLPDTTYQHSSGGDPEAIPSLTFGEFQKFYDDYYNPSNAYVYFFGDDDPTKRLEIVDEYFSQYEPRDTSKSQVAPQPLWDSPREYVGTAPSSEENLGKHMVSVNWLMAEDLFDGETQVAWVLLDSLLLGNPASALTKALNDSGLGDQVIGHGSEHSLRQPMYCVGLSGVAEENVERVEELIVDVLSHHAEHGFEKDHLEATVNSLRFMIREPPRNGYGLPLMLNALPYWIHHGDPVDQFFFEKPLQAVCDEVLRDGSTMLQDLLRKHLLNNPHKLRVHLKPDAEFGDKREAAERERLRAIRDGMDGNDLARVRDEQEALLIHQNTPDPPEKLALVPTLHLEDLSPDALIVPREVTHHGSTTVVQHEQPTQAIMHLSLGFNLAAVDNLTMLPLFLRALRTLPTTRRSDVAMARAIDTHTGGIGFTTSLTPRWRAHDEVIGHAFVQGKALSDKTDMMCDLMLELLQETDFNHPDLVSIMVRDTITSLENALVSSGNSVVSLHLSTLLCHGGYLGGQMGGVTYLKYLRELEGRISSDWDAVRQELEAMRAQLLSSSTVASVTADEDTLTSSQPAVQRLLDTATQGYAGDITAMQLMESNWQPPPADVHGVAFTVPTQVNYVGKAMRLAPHPEDLGGSTSVIDSIVRTTWLWNTVRVSGGAYGVSAGYDHFSGVYAATSYRDPNLSETLANYDGIAEFLRHPDLSEEDVRKAIISTIGSMDSPLTPADKGDVSFSRFMAGISNEDVQKRRTEILQTSLHDARAFADRLDSFAEQGITAAVTSDEAYARDAAAQLVMPEVQKLL